MNKEQILKLFDIKKPIKDITPEDINIFFKSDKLKNLNTEEYYFLINSLYEYMFDSLNIETRDILSMYNFSIMIKYETERIHNLIKEYNDLNNSEFITMIRKISSNELSLVLTDLFILDNNLDWDINKKELEYTINKLLYDNKLISDRINIFTYSADCTILDLIYKISNLYFIKYKNDLEIDKNRLKEITKLTHEFEENLLTKPKSNNMLPEQLGLLDITKLK